MKSNSAPLQPVQLLWLDALVSARHVLKPEQIRDIWNTTRLIQDTTATQACYAYEVVDGERDVYIRHVTSLPAIEARELLLYVAGRRSLQLRQSGAWVTEQDLFTRLGCFHQNSPLISERWRKLHMIRNLAELPYAGLEDRPKCKICSGRVATGAGWNPGQAGLDTQVFGSYRPDLHHECKNYAMTVLVPQYQASRAEKARVAAEVDK